MADEIDKAADHEMAMREAAIRNASVSVSVLKACGKCLNCRDELPADLRFCNKFCRDDFERRNEEPARLYWE